MKIKLDFVTNSSTTSFCAWGKIFDKDELTSSEVIQQKIIDKYKQYYKEQGKIHVDDMDFEEISDNIDINDELYDILESQGLNVYRDDYNMYIGVHPTDIPHDKSINEVLSNLQKIFSELGIDDGKQIEWIEEAFYN